MSGYTPGPWVVGQSTTGNIVSLRTYDTIARLEHEHGGTVMEPGALAANARLITATPDLVEAGELIVEAFGVAPDEIIAGAFGDDMLAAVKALRAALAKAGVTL